MAGMGENNDDAQDELFWTEETRTRPNDDIEVDDSFVFPHEVCWSCEGFYGPCFGEHFCAMCHIFLFPDDINVPKNLLSEKSDDEDSGNDEPVEPLAAEGFQMLNSVPSSPGDLPPTDDDAELVPQPLLPVLGTDRLAEHLSLLTQAQPIADTGDINRLPCEILLGVFLYLDDLSLWAASRVCVRWKLLVEKNFTNDQWRHFTLHRWRLFKPLYPIHDWAAVYSDLVESSTCFRCLYRSDTIPSAGVPVNPWRSKRMSSEWKSLKTDPVEGIKATPLYRASALDWCGHWQASITGPANSPYEGGIFYLHIQIPNSYPIEPPSVRFITKVFHPNVSRHGNIGLDCIQGNWSLALTIPKILISVQSLLTDPYCKVSMEPEVARIYQTERQRFDAIARWWTWKYAMSDAPKPERNNSCSNNHDS